MAVDVPPGASLVSLLPTLARRGVVDHPLLFRVWLQSQPARVLRPGPYVLYQHEPYGSVLATLDGGPHLLRLMIPPGFTLGQIGAALHRLMPSRSAAGLVAAGTDGQVRSPYEPASSHTLEGLLYPDTYFIAPSTTDAAILTMMVQRFDSVAASIHLSERARAMGMSPYEIATIASMVEREAKVPTDRGKVARVIYNRLATNMPLQIDATVLYGLGNPTRPLTAADLGTPSPYNTYLNRGLPPTPIASPGISSLQAALAPTPGPWLYYVVVSPNGAEAFSTTLSGQQRNIALASSRGL